MPFFVKHAPVLIGAVREMIMAQGDQIPGNHNPNVFNDCLILLIEELFVYSRLIDAQIQTIKIFE